MGFVEATAPPVAGNIATEIAIRAAKTVRTTSMGVTIGRDKRGVNSVAFGPASKRHNVKSSNAMAHQSASYNASMTVRSSA